MKIGADFEPFFREEQVMTLTVDYDQPVSEYFLRGKYEETPHYPDARIPNTYRGVGTAVKPILLLKLKAPATTETILAEMERFRLRPVGAHELLSIGAHDPIIQVKNQIVGLGAIWNGSLEGPYALALAFYLARRRVVFTWPHRSVRHEWQTNVLFAATPLAA